MGDIRGTLIKSLIEKSDKYELITDFPVAIQSNDHLHPRGTKYDNTRHPRFVAACEKQFSNKQLSFLDLGCAGGGLVYDFLHRGHHAIGLEGSDFSKINQRAEWRVIPNNLYTCDITKPFLIKNLSKDCNAQFDIISMWEVLEHILEADQPVMFKNIYDHLATGGYFVGSIAMHDDIFEGVSFHPTLHDPIWWKERFKDLGFNLMDNKFLTFGDNCRGVSNGPFDSNFMENPQMGFHFVAQKIS
jgi:SAM-dependent methyltransferase